MTCINRQRALLAGHDGEHQDAIDDLMEVWGADAVREDGEIVGFPWERRR
jgi:hypothetical protein